MNKKQALIVLKFMVNAEKLRAEMKAKNTITPSVGVYGQMFRRGSDKSRLIHDSRVLSRF